MGFIDVLCVENSAYNKKNEYFKKISNLVKEGEKVPVELEQEYLQELKKCYIFDESFERWTKQQDMEQLEIKKSLFLNAAAKENKFSNGLTPVVQLAYEKILLGMYLKKDPCNQA